MNTTRTLLIYPKLECALFKDVKLPPLGIAYIAGVLRKADHEVKLLDGNILKDQLKDIKKAVIEYSPGIVGISASTSVMRVSMEIAQLVKDIDKNIKIMMGGVHPTLFPKNVIHGPCVDYVVYGEGEETVLELIEAIREKKEQQNILGVVYKKKREIIKNAPRPLIKNLDNLPFPAYDLLPMKEYCSPQILKTPFTSMITSRGCPYQCIFCDAGVVFGKKYRFYSPERTVKEIKYLINRFNIKEIMFKDSDFTLHKGRVEAFCDLMIDEGLNLLWSCNGRVGTIDKALVKKMKKAGCRLIQYGVESGDQEVLNTLKKGIKVEQIKETFKISKEAGLKTVANFMVGNPGETEESIQKTIKLVREIKADYGNFGFVTPFPGTELYTMACKNNWLLENFDLLSMKSEKCVMNATKMNTQKLQQMLSKLYKSFYFRPGYILSRGVTLSPYEWKMNIKGLFRILNI